LKNIIKDYVKKEYKNLPEPVIADDLSIIVSEGYKSAMNHLLLEAKFDYSQLPTEMKSRISLFNSMLKKKGDDFLTLVDKKLLADSVNKLSDTDGSIDSTKLITEFMSGSSIGNFDLSKKNIKSILNVFGQKGVSIFILSENGSLIGNFSDLITFLSSKDGEKGYEVIVARTEKGRLSFSSFNITRENFFYFFPAKKYFEYTPDDFAKENSLEVLGNKIPTHRKDLSKIISLNEEVKVEIFSDINGNIFSDIKDFDKEEFFEKVLPFSGRVGQSDSIRTDLPDGMDGYKSAIELVKSHPESEEILQKYAMYAGMTEKEFYDTISPKNGRKRSYGTIFKNRFELILKVANKINKMKRKLGTESEMKPGLPIQNALVELEDFAEKKPTLKDLKDLAIFDPISWGNILINNLKYQKNGFVGGEFELTKRKLEKNIVKLGSIPNDPNYYTKASDKIDKLIEKKIDDLNSSTNHIIDFVRDSLKRQSKRVKLEKELNKFKEQIGGF